MNYVPLPVLPPEATDSLESLFPEELAFFKQRFLWVADKRGVYISNRYEDVLSPEGKLWPKWRPCKARGQLQPLHSKLVNSLAEKHLDLERFINTCEDKDQLRIREDELAFWVGGMAGEKTYYHAFDIDSHDRIGWVLLPTRWHPDRTGWAGGGPYDYRHVPFMKPSLRFFMIAKLVYDLFPGRLWTFFSGSLGLAVWQMYDKSQLTEVLHRRFGNRLRAIGLALEQYPEPSKQPPKPGCAHRRPCGMDTGVITDNGVVTGSIEQVRCFMKPVTPSFDVIVDSCWEMLKSRCAQFVQLGGGPVHNCLSYEERLGLVEECWNEVEKVKAWVTQGCPIDMDLIRSSPPSSPSITDQFPPSHLICGGLIQPAAPEPLTVDSVDPAFLSADLAAINENGQWVQFVKFLVETGIPAEDRFVEVVSTLARWFCFVELCGQKAEQIKHVLKEYVLSRHNGKITRLNNGHVAEVLAHVDRIVSHVLTVESEHGLALFAELRRRRETGGYKLVFNFEPQILDEPEYDVTVSHNEGDWAYEPDMTPLPTEIEARIRQAFSGRKRQLRRNKHGRYPMLDAITRFINYLMGGRTPGTRRASRELLQKMGLPSNGEERLAVLKILEDANAIERGSYRSRSASRSWRLADDVVDALQRRNSSCAILNDQIECRPS